MKPKILYLYAEVMGYTLATIEEFVKCGYEVHIIHWDKNKKTPFFFNKKAGLFFYNRSELSSKAIFQLYKKINPAIVIVSGWMDKAYLLASMRIRFDSTPVVLALDTQWTGSLKQKLFYSLIKTKFCLLFYSHAWVPGVKQFEFARNLGFPDSSIIQDLYSADIKNFTLKKNSFSRRFLYVGRFEKSKGLFDLLMAWDSLGKNKKGWELHLIGNGSLFNLLKTNNTVLVRSFMQPKDLKKEIKKGGCFILPSTYEPWGVVVHEFATSGFPLILSDKVGARFSFLISGFNGYIFKSADFQSLAEKMQKIIGKSDSKLYQMGKNSMNLSKRITPKTSAKNLLSILN